MYKDKSKGLYCDEKEWQNHIEELLGLEKARNSWISDRDLYQFFKEEISETDNSKRLSTSVGNGFY